MNFKAFGENLGLEEDEYRELVEFFLETSQVDYEALKLACEAKKVETIRHFAHNIAGAAGNLGLMELHQCTAQIELEVHQNNLNNLRETLDKMQTMFTEIEYFFRTSR